MSISHPINLTGEILTEDEKKIISLILGRGNCLRSTKPKIDPNDEITGDAAYVWRWVAFTISNNRQHWCMPMSADFGLNDKYWGPGYKWKIDNDISDDEYATILRMKAEIRNKHEKKLLMLVDRIIASVPKEFHYGTVRWSKVF